MQGPLRLVHPAVQCVFVVLAASAGVKSVPILHLSSWSMVFALPSARWFLFSTLYYASCIALRKLPTTLRVCELFSVKYLYTVPPVLLYVVAEDST